MVVHNYSNLRFYDCNNLDRLFDSEKYEKVLTRMEMEALYNYLVRTEEPPREYDVFSPVGEIDNKGIFLDTFLSVLDGYRQIHQEMEEGTICNPFVSTPTDTIS